VLIPLKDLTRFWDVNSTGVIHVGAHQAEEAEDYLRLGFGNVVWVEAQPDLIEELRNKIAPPSRVIHALVWNKSGIKMNLKVASNGQSSSVFELGTHKESYPHIEVSGFVELTTSRLEDILPQDINYNFLNLDIQGAEFEAMEGLGSLLAKFDYIYTEVNRAQLYRGIKEIEAIDEFLQENDFRRVATVWTDADWGDALYIRVQQPTGFFSSLSLDLKTLLYRVILWYRNGKFTSLLRAIGRRIFRISQSKAP
jgi:FkbM family methyltransferase